MLYENMQKFKYVKWELWDVPTITVSEDDKKCIEKLRKDMPLINSKVPNVKKTIELMLKFVEERKSDFIQWTEKNGQER